MFNTTTQPQRGKSDTEKARPLVKKKTKTNKLLNNKGMNQVAYNEVKNLPEKPLMPI